MARTKSPRRGEKKRETKVIKPVNSIIKNGINLHNSIYKTLKYLHGDLAITKDSVEYINALANGLINRFCVESAKICKRNHSDIVNAEIIQTATKLLLNGSLTKAAINNGIRSVKKYSEIETLEKSQTEE